MVFGAFYYIPENYSDFIHTIILQLRLDEIYFISNFTFKQSASILPGKFCLTCEIQYVLEKIIIHLK
jgi:hypothetical protein